MGQCFIPSLASLICSAVVSSFSDVLGVAQAKEKATGSAPENLEYENLKERVERSTANVELWWEWVPDRCVQMHVMTFPLRSSVWSGDGRAAECRASCCMHGLPRGHVEAEGW